MTTITKINGKQTKITLSDGTRCKAKPDKDKGCAGCYFWPIEAVCPRMPEGVICASGARMDGRSVIWVRRPPKEPKPLKDLDTSVQ